MQQLPASLRKFPIPGRVLQEWIIPAKGYCAFHIKDGQVMRLIDIEGKQCTDVVAFNSFDHSEEMSMGSSLLANRVLELRKGMIIYSQVINPMFTITDYSNEVSFSYGSMCSEEVNRLRYGVAGTVNCRDNLAMALESWGFNRREIPNAFSPFMRVEMGDDGLLEIKEPTSGAGDFYDMRAEMDVLVGISNCPQELNACNGFNATASGVIIFESQEML